MGQRPVDIVAIAIPEGSAVKTSIIPNLRRFISHTPVASLHTDDAINGPCHLMPKKHDWCKRARRRCSAQCDRQRYRFTVRNKSAKHFTNARQKFPLCGLVSRYLAAGACLCPDGAARVVNYSGKYTHQVNCSAARKPAKEKGVSGITPDTPITTCNINRATAGP